MERDELACVAASYGIDFDHGKDVKTDIIKKLEKARNTGRGLLMITDDRENEEKEVEDSDEDFNADDESDWSGPSESLEKGGQIDPSLLPSNFGTIRWKTFSIKRPCMFACSSQQIFRHYQTKIKKLI